MSDSKTKITNSPLNTSQANTSFSYSPKRGLSPTRKSVNSNDNLSPCNGLIVIGRKRNLSPSRIKKNKSYTKDDTETKISNNKPNTGRYRTNSLKIQTDFEVNNTPNTIINALKNKEITNSDPPKRNKKKKKKRKKLRSTTGSIQKKKKSRNLDIKMGNILTKDIKEAERDIIKIQRWVRGILIKNKFKDLSTKYKESEAGKSMSSFIYYTKELVESEKRYIEYLEILVNVYYNGMKDLTVKQGFFTPAIISEKDHSRIFMNILLILEFNKDFYKQLSKEYYNEYTGCIRLGSIIIKLSPFLKLYTDYFNNFEQSRSLYNKLQEKQAFKDWLKSIKVKYPTIDDLPELIFMPCQRILKYKLLLENIIKYMPNDHVDYNDITTSLLKISEIAEYLNENQRESENMAKINKVQVNIKGLDMNLAHPLRKLLYQGELYQFNKTNNCGETRYFYLFSDMLLSTILSNNSYIYDGYILIRNASIIKLKDDFAIQYNKEKTICYQANSKQETDKWMTCFKKAIDEISQIPIEKSSDYKLDKEDFGVGYSKYSTLQSYEFDKVEMRWFVLKHGILYKYESSSSEEYLQVMQLENYRIRSKSCIYMHGPAIDLVNPCETYTIIFNSKEEKKLWIKLLKNSIKDINLPITDLCVIQMDKGDIIPLGYIPILETYYGHTGNTNSTGKGRDIIICYKKGGRDENGNLNKPITDVSIVCSESGSIFKRSKSDIELPNGWEKISKTYYDTDVADLNRGNGGRYIYLVYKKELNKTPITRLSMFWDKDYEQCPPNFVPIEFALHGNHKANLNGGAKGVDVYICYQKETAIDNFLFSKLGWNPHRGFNELKMKKGWKDILNSIGIETNEFKDNPELIIYIVEEIIIKYQELNPIIDKQEISSVIKCYSCNCSFEYPKETNKVLCPSCKIVNQCTFISKHKLENQYGSWNTNELLNKTNIKPKKYASDLPAYAANIPGLTVYQKKELPIYLSPGCNVYSVQIPTGRIVIKQKKEKKEMQIEEITINFDELVLSKYKELVEYGKYKLHSYKNDHIKLCTTIPTPSCG